MSDNINIEKNGDHKLVSESLVVTYEGIKNVFPSNNSQNISTMEVDVYADSLKALSCIINEANKIINGKKIKISVEISTTDKGSFKAVLKIFGMIPSVLVSIAAIVSILNDLGFDTENFPNNVRSYLEKTKEHKIIDKKYMDNICRIRLTDSKGKEVFMSFPSDLCRLCENQKIKNNFCKMVEPVKKNKVEKISIIKQGAKKGFSVDKNDVHLYDIEHAEEEIIGEFSGEFKIETLSFRPQGKWKLYNNKTPVFIAKIEDEEFLRRINNNREFFLKDSKLTCKIIEKQNPNAIKQKSKYYIREIKNEHPIQEQLPFLNK